MLDLKLDLDNTIRIPTGKYLAIIWLIIKNGGIRDV